jgi:DNA-binding XRE family transcriptional regulator
MVKNIEKNSLREIRESLMMSRAELSRNADISALTITRIERQAMQDGNKTKDCFSLRFRIIR